MDNKANKGDKSISAEDAAVILTLKEAYSALNNFGFKEGMDVLIYGDGPVGLALTTFLRISGAAWIGCIGHRSDRLEIILKKGKADVCINSHKQDVDSILGDRKIDLVIDAVGKTDIIYEGASRLAPGGKVGVYGVLKQKDSKIDLLKIPNNTGIHVLNFPYDEHSVHDELINMILNKKIELKDFYSHVIPVEDVQKAYEMIQKRKAFKVILKY